jgi:hypothetical protein
MPSDVEDQQLNGNSTHRGARWFSRLLKISIFLMLLNNSVIIFAQSVSTQLPCMVVALPWLTGTWFILAIILVAIASIYVVVFDSNSSVLVPFPVVVTLVLTFLYSPFARIVLGICLSYTSKYVHNGRAPPLPEWPSWIDLGLILGWAVDQLCRSGGGPQTPHRRRYESPIAPTTDYVDRPCQH